MPASSGCVSVASLMLPPVVCGLTLHLLFNKFDHTRSWGWLERLALVLPLGPSYFSRHHYSSIWASAFTTYNICYLTLVLSVIAYRLSPIHPLAKYPGPLLAKCTKLWGVYQSYTGKVHNKTLELHRHYGSVVRIGPNELSMSDADFIQPALGVNGMGKGPIWDGRKLSSSTSAVSLLHVRNQQEHLRRRKTWNHAFSSVNVKQYDPVLRVRLDQLEEALRAKKELDVAEYISFFAYDFMSDMAFGGGFNLVRDGDVDGIWAIMEDSLPAGALIQHIPWVLPFFYPLIPLSGTITKFLAFTSNLAGQRIRKGSTIVEKDISYHLLGEEQGAAQLPPTPEYIMDSILTIGAGSDTSATVMSSAVYSLLCNRECLEKLRLEIDENFPRGGLGSQRPQDDLLKLSGLPYLNAVINETMRLYPPVAVNIQRAPEEGSNGKMVGSIFVPEGTAVQLPPYTIHRDPRYFSPDPNRFWPERWLLSHDKNVVTDQAAFIPFSTGPMNCVGKTIALTEMRAVIATLVHTFEMELKAGWDAREWEMNLKDYFIFKKGVLPLAIKPRV